MSKNCNTKQSERVVLVTGAARRVGAAIVKHFHMNGFRVIIHYRQSSGQAKALQAELNSIRADSARTVAFDLTTLRQLPSALEPILAEWGGLTVLVNNASAFYKTTIGDVTCEQWDNLMQSNVRGAFFLSQALLPFLQKSQGAIVNITDIHAERPMRDYSVYCISKSALLMMTKALAKELAPEVRVNAVAPGVVELPEGENALSAPEQAALRRRIPMNAFGQAEDVATSVYFLACHASYVTGQVLATAGGRLLNL